VLRRHRRWFDWHCCQSGVSRSWEGEIGVKGEGESHVVKLVNMQWDGFSECKPGDDASRKTPDVAENAGLVFV